MKRLHLLHRVPHTLALSFGRVDLDIELPHRLDLGDPSLKNGREEDEDVYNKDARSALPEA